LENDALTLPPYALAVLRLLEQEGFEAWLVGGFVRDSLMGRAAADIDIATSAPWQASQALFEQAGLATFETGVAHGTLSVLAGGHTLEVTTFRADGAYSDARHPDEVTFIESIAQDLARRDFTANAIAFHPERGLLDPFGGCDDIARKVLRAVGDPQERFAEDALRILRAVRFASQLGFSIEGETFAAMLAQKGLLGSVAAERVRHELDAFVCGPAVHDALMGCIDIVGQVIGELLPLRGFDQRTPYHIYDVLEHTAYCMENTPATPLVRWAALFHDTGKPEAFSTDKAGVGHFYGHAEASTRIAREAMRRLKFPNALADDVATLVEYHDVIFAATHKSVKRRLRKLGGRTDLLFALAALKRGDALAQAPGSRKRLDLANEIEATLRDIVEAQEAFSLSALAIDGDDLQALGIPPGPQIGRLLDAALSAVIDEEVANDKAALTAFLLPRP